MKVENSVTVLPLSNFLQYINKIKEPYLHSFIFLGGMKQCLKVLHGSSILFWNNVAVREYTDELYLCRSRIVLENYRNAFKCTLLREVRFSFIFRPHSLNGGDAIPKKSLYGEMTLEVARACKLPEIFSVTSMRN